MHDAGHSINPALDKGQVEGGFVQGVGWLTTEELMYDDQGALMTHAPSTYKIPACSDRPQELMVSLYDSEGNQSDTIHRSKAVGEPPLMLGISVFSAISDAIRGCAKSAVFPKLDAPATAERILMTIQEHKKL